MGDPSGAQLQVGRGRFQGVVLGDARRLVYSNGTWGQRAAMRPDATITFCLATRVAECRAKARS